MPLSPQTLEEKPYNMCIACDLIGINCDGPNFLSMEIDRWCEWCRIRKEYLGWTNQRVADLADISKISVDRIMAGKVADLRISTMQAITRALVNGSWGKHPCPIAELSTEKEIVYVDNPEMVNKCERLKATLESLDAAHKEEMREAWESGKRKDKLIFLLVGLAAVSILTLVGFVGIDALHSHLGLF